MFAFLRGGLGNALRTKVGLALIGALLVGGGGTAMAMATANGHTPFGSALSSSTHSDEAGKTPGGTKTADKDDQDEDCTSGTHATPSAHSDDGSEHEGGTPSAHASPTAHSDDASEHEGGTPSATRAAGQSSDEANEHESAQDEQDECAKSTTTRTPHPEPTERPEGTEGTHSAGPTPTKGPGGD
jgi:hypothetical protein